MVMFANATSAKSGSSLSPVENQKVVLYYIMLQ